MAEQTLILDYASPRPRGKVRLPAESKLDIRGDKESLQIIETLKGRSRALAAITFGVFVLIVIGLACGYSARMAYLRPSRYGLESPIILGTLWLAEAVLAVIVLNQTYRSTIVRVQDSELILQFKGLFSGTRTYRWPVSEIGEIRVEPTQLGAGMAALAELQIRPTYEVSVHLFTDHRMSEVQMLAVSIQSAVRGEFAPPATVAVLAELAGPDEAVMNRLMERHRQQREADRARRIS